MREKGLKETGCNAAIRAINAYLHWSGGSERKCGAGCTHPRISQLKEPQNILPMLSEACRGLIAGWKPGKSFHRRRLHLLTLLMSGSRCRISEALGLVRVRDVDMENCSSRQTGREESNGSSRLVSLCGVRCIGSSRTSISNRMGCFSLHERELTCYE